MCCAKVLKPLLSPLCQMLEMYDCYIGMKNIKLFIAAMKIWRTHLSFNSTSKPNPHPSSRDAVNGHCPVEGR